MRLLFLTPQLPYPPHKGTTLRNYNLIKGLAARHEIDLLSFVESPDELGAPTPLNPMCRRVDGVPVPRRTLLARARDTLFSPWPDMALRLWSPQFAARLQIWLAEQRYDIVQVEGIEMARYGFQISNLKFQVGERPRLVFDDHNCEYVLQQRTFETDARHPRRWLAAGYSFIQWQKLRRFEAQVCRAVQSVVAVSDADAAALRRLVPSLDVTVVPNGIDLANPHAKRPISNAKRQASNGKSEILNLQSGIVFTGTMDFRPNVDAVLWFASHVLPRILAQEPDAHFYVVGQRPHRRLDGLRGNPAITLTGAVDDVRPYVENAAVYVVPLRMGGGTRFKILEAAAQRRAIVSTSLGCEGFPVQPGRELVIADAPAEFADAVVALLRDPARRAQLGESAYRLAEAFDWRKIIPRLEALYGEDREFR
jgi:sugar transferase (PEP-CTERM/EpsH1 system associated)